MVRILSFFKKQQHQYMTDANLHRLRHSPILTCYVGPYNPEPRTNPVVEQTQQTLEASLPPTNGFNYPIFAYYPSYPERPLCSHRPSSSQRVTNAQRPNSITLVAPKPNTRATRRRVLCPHRPHRYSDASKHYEFWVIEEEEEEEVPLSAKKTIGSDATPIISSSVKENVLERRVRFSRGKIRFSVDTIPDEQNTVNSKGENLSRSQD